MRNLPSISQLPVRPPATQGQDGLLPTLNVPPMEAPPRIVAVGALTTMLVPLMIRFELSVAVEVAYPCQDG